MVLINRSPNFKLIMNTRTSINLDPSLIEHLQQKAAEQGTAVSDVVTRLIEEDLAQPAGEPTSPRHHYLSEP